ncbi:MAG: GGDEF domain-containing protein [Methylobacteriaceae bacterium]|nr:GGDEF domain-containing protein [Methylobacteriaceae bacterium]
MIADAAPDPQSILKSIGEIVYDWDMITDRLTWSDNAGAVLKVADPGKITTGRGYAELLAPQSTSSRHAIVHQPGATDHGEGVGFNVVYGLLGADRTLMWVEDAGRWYADLDGRPIRAQGAVRIVTDRHEETQRLAYESRYDPLTGSLNRQGLFEFAERLFAAPATRRAPFAVLLAAIENVDVVNRSYGYDIADALIASVARLLREQLRALDVIARYSGSKIAIVLDACEGERMESAARRLLKALGGMPIATSAGALTASLRIGGVMDAHLARDTRALMKRAEEALDIARESAAQSFVAYSPSLARDQARDQNRQIANNIIAALNSRRVFLAYQPIIACTDGAPAHYEALVRIREEDGSIALPGALLPVAERVGLVQLLDQRVMELALAELAEHPNLTIAINVSATTALDLTWPLRVAQAIALHPGTAERLIIELTETRAIEDIEATSRVIAELKTLGVRVAMDDFGAGHTSFKNLRKLGVDLLKIDGAFIRNLSRSEDDRFFVRTLIKLARYVGIPVVAEWVEDVESAQILRDWGVGYLQGHYFGEAAPLKSVGTRSSRQAGFDA